MTPSPESIETAFQDGAVKLDGLDEAIIAVAEGKALKGPCLVYSKQKIMDILVMTNVSVGLDEATAYEDALDYMDFSILDLDAGPQSPIFI